MRVMVVLSDAEKEYIDDQFEMLVTQDLEFVDEKSFGDSIKFLKKVFIDGYDIQLENGVIVHVKMTLERLSNMLGEEETEELKKAYKRLAAGIFVGVCAEWILARMIWALVVFNPINYVAAATVIGFVGVTIFNYINRKEETKDDNRIQEDC